MAVVLGEPSGRARGIRAASLLEHGFQNYGWKQLFNTVSLENMPLKPDVGKVESVRHTVTSWSCNPKRKVRRVKKKRSKAKRQRSAKKKVRSSKRP